MGHNDESSKANGKMSPSSRMLSDIFHFNGPNKNVDPTTDPTQSVSASSSLKSLASSSSSATLYPDPPDGGYGWVVVSAAFMSFVLADGIQLSIGLIFDQIQKEFGAGKGESAIIAAIFLGMPLLAAPLVSPIIDAYDCRVCTIVGGLLSFSGVFLSVFAPNLVILALTFGVITGLGLSFVFSAPMIAVTYYFDRRRALASGIAASGSGFGTMMFAPICEVLFENYGWKGTLLILSAILLNLVVCGALIRDLQWPADTIEYKTDKFLRALDAGQSASRLSRDTNLSAMTSATGAWTAWPKPDVEAPTINARNAVSCMEIPSFVRDYMMRSERVSGTSSTTDVLEQQKLISGVVPHELSKSASMMPTARMLDVFGQRILTPVRKRRQKRSFRLSESQPEDFHFSMDSDCSAHHMSRFLSMVEFSPDSSETNFVHPKSDHSNGSAIPAEVVSEAHTKPVNDFSTSGYDYEQCNGMKPNDDCLPMLTESRTSAGADPEMQRARRRGLSEFGIVKDSNGIVPKPVTYYHLRSQLAFARYNAAKRVLSAPELRKLIRVRRQRKTFRVRLKRFCNEAKSTLLTDWKLLQTNSFFVFFLSHFILYAFNDIPYVNTPDFAESVFGGKSASLLVSVLGVFNTLGMVFFGVLGDKKSIDAYHLMAVSLVISGLAILVVPFLPSFSFAALVVVSVVYGFFAGSLDGLTSVALVELCSLSHFVHAYGLVNFASGIGNVVGPTLAGYLYDWTGTYTATYVVGGIGTMAAGCMVCVVPWLRRLGRQPPAGPVVVEADDFVQLQRKQPGDGDVGLV